MTFEVDIGHTTRSGPREVNEDFAGAMQPKRASDSRGLIAAIADGVSAGGNGLEAAQTTVMALLSDYFGTPDTWEPTATLDRLVAAQNAWLADHNRRRQGPGSSHGAGLTTLTALALHGQSFTIAHVGDTRAWRIRKRAGHGAEEGAGEASTAPAWEGQQLTQDHAFDHPDQRSRLTRAIGLDDSVRVDYVQGELRIGDGFVLTSDGVHGVLKPAYLAELACLGSAQQASEALVEAAISAGTRDNATALVVRIMGLDTRQLQDELGDARRLAPPPRLKVGDALDGYTVTALIADTGVHLLYQARGAGRELVALKTLHPSRGSDPEERAMLAHEAWLGLRVGARGERGFVRVHERSEAATALYTVFDWHGGQTLEQLLKSQPVLPVQQGVAAAIAWATALGRLHRHGVVHRDIKPGNLHLGDDGQWRILDLGVALSGREDAAQRELHAGTPSYINPEQWDGALPDAGSDLYALGVTLYQAFTGRLPHGEIEPYQLARYRHDPVAPSRRRPDMPIWLDHLVLKLIAREPRQRFETAEELLLALERGASRGVGAPPATPLLQRDPLVLWQVGLAISVLFNALLIYWLLFLPR